MVLAEDGPGEVDPVKGDPVEDEDFVADDEPESDDEWLVPEMAVTVVAPAPKDEPPWALSGVVVELVEQELPNTASNMLAAHADRRMTTARHLPLLVPSEDCSHRTRSPDLSAGEAQTVTGLTLAMPPESSHAPVCLSFGIRSPTRPDTTVAYTCREKAPQTNRQVLTQAKAVLMIPLPSSSVHCSPTAYACRLTASVKIVATKQIGRIPFRSLRFRRAVVDT
jgi:hypothetical protein